jgi:hypothetical protein
VPRSFLKWSKIGGLDLNQESTAAVHQNDMNPAPVFRLDLMDLERASTMTDLKYPMLDLVTGQTTMSLMYVNIMMTSYLMLVTTPWIFVQALMERLGEVSAS